MRCVEMMVRIRSIEQVKLAFSAIRNIYQVDNIIQNILIDQQETPPMDAL